MKIAVLGQPDGWYVREILHVAQNRGHIAVCVDFETLQTTCSERNVTVSGFLSGTSESICLNDQDAIIIRTMPPGSLEQVVYRMDVLQQLEARGVLILNTPKAIEVAVDKFLTTARLAAAGLPTPRTIACETSEQARQAMDQLGGDVVVKPLFGSEGRGIFRVSDPDLAVRAFRTLERLQSVIYLQEFISHGGFDLRILMLDGQVVGAIRRENPEDFRTNVSRQGIAAPHETTDEERFLATQAAKIVGSCFAGVDLMYDPSGRCLIIEVNAVPGWRALQQVTGVPVAQRLVEYVENLKNVDQHC